MQFRPFAPDIEVNGQTVYAVIDGFTVVRTVPSRILASEGIGKLDRDGNLSLDPGAWYSQGAWLRAFEKIAREVGTSVLYSIGLAIPKNAIFPPQVTDIETAIQSIDVAYHLNHRKNGTVLFNPANGQMLEGIGHYGYDKVTGKNEIVSVCENPYPCRFDHGIITTMATRFESRARVVHDDSKPCRDKGAAHCTYRVTW